MNSQAAIQQLMNYDVNDTPNQIEVRTDTLEPIQATANKFTFRLDQAGYLDLNSMLVFKHEAATTNNQRVNPWNGALGGIKRAILQVGDHILNDVQDVYKYATMSRINVPPTQRNQFFGHYLGLQWHSKIHGATAAGSYQDSGIDIDADSYTSQDLGTIGSMLVDPIKSGLKKGAATDGTGVAINSYGIGTNVDNNPQYGITLGMLFPALKGQKIPLFLFDKQRILLKVEFNPVAEYVCDIADNNYNNAGQLAPQTALGLNNVRLIVDYVIMGGEVQNEVMAQTQKQGGYRLEFYDVVNVIKGIDAGAFGSRRDIEHRIGQNGREVHNIFMWKQFVNDTDFQNNFAGLLTNTNVGAKCLLRGQHCIGVENEEYNCEVNGREEFTDFKFNPVSQYNELKVALGRPIYVDKPMYCNDENTTASLLSMLNNGMSGVMKPLAVGLRSGEPALVGGGRMIGNYPIVWKYRYTPQRINDKRAGNGFQSNTGFNVNYFIEVSRIANIRNTPKGMSVIVSY
jgi:hypothetical protein